MENLRSERQKISAPFFIQKRQYQLRSYVMEALFPERERIKRTKNMTTAERREWFLTMNAIVDECTWICYIFSLKQFFTEGTKAAINAVDTFKGLNIDGFHIGKKKFEGRNSNVMEGENLYKKLLLKIQDENLRKIIDDSTTYFEIVKRYKDVSF